MPPRVSPVDQAHLPCTETCTFPPCVNDCAYTVDDERGYHRCALHRPCLDLTLDPAKRRDALSEPWLDYMTVQDTTSIMYPTTVERPTPTQEVGHAVYAVNWVTQEAARASHLHPWCTSRQVY